MHTVRDVMNRFQVTQATVLGWIARGELKAVNVGRAPGKKKPRWRITAESLAVFEAGRTSSAPVERAPRRRRESADVVQFFA